MVYAMANTYSEMFRIAGGWDSLALSSIMRVTQLSTMTTEVMIEKVV